MFDESPLLVALDPRGCAHHVADTAAALAARLGVSARLVTCVELPDGVAADTVISDGRFEGATAVHALREDAVKALEALEGPFVRRGVAVTTAVAVGDPARQLVEMARSASMVVVGTHGRTGLQRLLFGSVAEAVVRQSPVPVLTVRSPGAGVHPSPVQQDVGALADG